MTDTTGTIETARSGDLTATPNRLPDLLPLLYDELRRLAAQYLRRERPNHTLQPTALVHEAYVRMAEHTAGAWRSRGHFFCVTAQAMRRILVNHAVHRRRIKRGGGRAAAPIDEQLLVCEDQTVDLVALDEALRRLAVIDPAKEQVVELRFFGGLSTEETAEALGVGEATVKRHWRMAKMWLLRELSGDKPAP